MAKNKLQFSMMEEVASLMRKIIKALQKKISQSVKAGPFISQDKGIDGNKLMDIIKK